MVADSEADLSELFCEVDQFPDNFHLIIRGFRQRKIESAFDLHNGKTILVDDVEGSLSQAEVCFCRTVEIKSRPAPTLPDDKKSSRKQARTARQATLEIRTIAVTIRGPSRLGGGKLPDAKINVVELREPHPPAGEPPIHWVLYTDLPVETFSQIESVIDSYSKRWQIELLFKTLKSGLEIENMRYETLERYQVAFAMLVVVGWRVEYLKGAARHDSESSCEKYFTKPQWMAIEMFVKKYLSAEGEQLSQTCSSRLAYHSEDEFHEMNMFDREPDAAFPFVVDGSFYNLGRLERREAGLEGMSASYVAHIALQAGNFPALGAGHHITVLAT
jgi:hypothetical protein